MLFLRRFVKDNLSLADYNEISILINYYNEMQCIVYWFIAMKLKIKLDKITHKIYINVL